MLSTASSVSPFLAKTDSGEKFTLKVEAACITSIIAAPCLPTLLQILSGRAFGAMFQSPIVLPCGRFSPNCSDVVYYSVMKAAAGIFFFSLAIITVRIWRTTWHHWRWS